MQILLTKTSSSGEKRLKMISQPVSRSDSQSVGQSVSQSASQSVSQSVSQSASQSASQSVSQSVSQPVSQSARQPTLKGKMIRSGLSTSSIRFLGLVLGSVESLENRINTFLRISQFQKHCFQILTLFSENGCGEDGKRLARSSIVLLSDRLYLLSIWL